MVQHQRRITTSHTDENPELNPDNPGGEPMMLPSTEGSAVSELYSNAKDRDKRERQKGWLGVTEEEAQYVTEYQDSEGNYYYYD